MLLVQQRARKVLSQVYLLVCGKPRENSICGEHVWRPSRLPPPLLPQHYLQLSYHQAQEFCLLHNTGSLSPVLILPIPNAETSEDYSTQVMGLFRTTLDSASSTGSQKICIVEYLVIESGTHCTYRLHKQEGQF